MNWKKVTLMWLVAIVVGFYTTFVLQTLWNWFAVEALHAPTISYWTMYGLMMLVRLVFDKNGAEMDERFKRLGILVQGCIRDDKSDEVRTAIEDEEKGLPLTLGAIAGGQAIANTLTLAIGFFVKAFLI